MIVECSHCGAPLDVHPGETVTKCRYCGRSDERKALRTIHHETPQDFRPPPRWRPPAHVAADSDEEYTYQGDGGWTPAVTVTVGAIVLAAALIPAVAIYAVRHGKPSTTPTVGAGKAPSTLNTPATTQGNVEVDPSTLAGVAIDGTLSQLKARLGGTVYQSSVTVYLKHDTWRSVQYSWRKGFDDHPAQVTFYPRRSPMSASFAGQLSAALLNGRVRPASYWDWANLRIELRSDGKTSDYMWCSVIPNPSSKPVDPGWRRKVQVAYRVLKEVALGQKADVTIEERRELLGDGYPLLEVAKIVTTTAVDDAVAHVTKIIPGASATSGSKLDVLLSIEHPRIAYVTLTWQNARDAKLGKVVLEGRRAGGAGLGPTLDDLSRCLGKTFGTPRVTDIDYLKKKHSYDWDLAGSHLTLADGGATLVSDATGKAPIPQAIFQTLVTTLANCE